MLTFACTGDVGAVVSGAEIVAGRQGIGGGAPGTDGLMRGTDETSCLSAPSLSPQDVTTSRRIVRYDQDVDNAHF